MTNLKCINRYSVQFAASELSRVHQGGRLAPNFAYLNPLGRQGYALCRRSTINS